MDGWQCAHENSLLSYIPNPLVSKIYSQLVNVMWTELLCENCSVGSVAK